MTNSKPRLIMVLLSVMFIAVMSCSSGKSEANTSSGQQLLSPYASLRDIPGITQDEINAIEALKAKYGSFICAVNQNTDSFVDNSGELSGYTILFYDWLSGLFGMPFKPVLFEWDDMLKGLDSREIAFTCELTDTPERRKSYFMTSGIMQHQIKMYRIPGSEPINDILYSRKPRYSFLEGSVVAADAAANARYAFETVFVKSHAEAYPLLVSGEVDAHIAMDATEAAFDAFGNVASEDFFPLVLESYCLSTRNAELRPIISVMEKALDAKTLAYLTSLQKTEYQKYLQNKLHALLTEEERSYIKNNPVVPIAAEYGNYPVSFFNAYANQWQGIYFDALHEIESMTGLTFECANGPGASYSELIAKLESGEALIIPELFQIKEYEGRFLTSEVPLLNDNFAFITKADFRDIEISEIPYLRTGVRRTTPYDELFNKMFPDHRYLSEYNTQEEVWNALKQGEVDVVFASRRRLITYTNYYEGTGYKMNISFDYLFDTSLGFNKNAAILRSIVDKALRLIKINNISNQWMNVSYDYQNKLAAARRPWLFGFYIMLVIFLAFLTFFLVRSRRTGKRLEKIVSQRTSELEQETATLRAIFNSSSDFIYCKDLNLNYTRCNKNMEAVFGVKEEDVVGKNDRDAFNFPAKTAEEFNAQDKMVLTAKEYLIFEDQIVLPSDPGNILYTETVKTPLILNGKLMGIVGISRNITKRKEIEKQIAYHSTLLKTIIDSLSDGIFCKDLDSKYTLMNKYMLDFLDKKIEDVIGYDDIKALGISGETLEAARETDQKIVNGQRRVLYEEWILCPDGITRLFETAKSPLVLDGSITGIVAVAHDITEHRMMEEKANEASRAKSAFLANMSHELRTPLNVVIGLTDLVLEESNLASHVKENLLKISNAGTTLLSIVNDILDFSKIESGKVELIPVTYYISSLLNDVITLVFTRLGEKPITFNLNISDDFPAKLYGDDLRVKQIFNNLLSNAIKYTHRGNIELSVSCRRESGYLLMKVSVRDTGIGISEENLQKLFTDYNQVDTRANRSIEGTGLGLAITKRLTELMGGEISVQSEYGKGSVFTVYIQQGFVSDAPIGPVVAENLRKFRYADDKRAVSKKLERHDLSYAKVLVVDDMQTNLDVASGLLRKYKMQVDCLLNGQDAIERIRSGTPVYNAIFMDHMMPGMDGIEAADKIRSIGSEYARRIPIIALTANAIQGTENVFFEHGFQAFISKPINIMEMDAVLKKWVHNVSDENSPEDSSSPYTTMPNNSYNEDEVKNENLPINIPGLDSEKGLSLYGDDFDIYLETLHSFVSNAPAVIEKLRTVSKETLPEYVINVHGLKGMSASIGAETTRETALSLEKMGKDGDLEGILAKNDKFIKDTENVLTGINEWLEKHEKENSDK